MSIELRYRIEESLKEKYDEFIIEEFGYKRNRCGSELEKAMKLYLAAKGDEEYQNDPDVLTIFEKAKQTFNQKSNKSESIPEKIEERLERKIDEKFEILTKKLEQQSKREVSKKYGHAEFKKQFQMAFNDHHQVSKRDLEQFIMNHADIVDKRSIQSRIQYLVSHEILEPFAPNVYNIVF